MSVHNKDNSEEKGSKAIDLITIYKSSGSSEDIKIVDKIPENVGRGDTYFLEKYTLEMVKNGDNKEWNATSGNPKKIYDSNGNIVHYQGGQYIRKIRGGRHWSPEVLTSDTEIYQIRFHYATHINTVNLSRKLSEITQLQPERNRLSPAVIAEFQDSQNRKRKLNPVQPTTKPQPTHIAPAPSPLKQPAVIKDDSESFPQISSGGDSCPKLEDIGDVCPMEYIPEHPPNMMDQIDKITVDLTLTSISTGSVGRSPPNKYPRESTDSQMKESLLLSNSDELNEVIQDAGMTNIVDEILQNPDLFNDEYSKYENQNIDKIQYLGPVLPINSTGSLIEVAHRYIRNKTLEWSKICTDPLTLTLMHSRPYLGRIPHPESDKVTGFIAMFSLCNHSPGMCVLKSKLLKGAPINDELILPLQCQMEVTFEGSSNVDSIKFTYKKLNAYAEELLLLNIKHCNQSEFPKIFVKIC